MENKSRREFHPHPQRYEGAETRLELVLETVRAALEEVARTAPEVLDGLVTAEWASATGGRCGCAASPAVRSGGSARPNWRGRWPPGARTGRESLPLGP